MARTISTRRKGNSTSAAHCVLDLLPGTFVVERSESGWLATLLSEAELRYIFDGAESEEGEVKMCSVNHTQMGLFGPVDTTTAGCKNRRTV
ncbi:MAG: hypothetical protein ABI240_08835 [Sphingomonas sp.]